MNPYITLSAFTVLLIAGGLLMLSRTGKLYRIAALAFVSLTALSAFSEAGIVGFVAVVALFGIAVPLGICIVTRLGCYLAWRRVGQRFQGQPKHAPSRHLSYLEACRLMAGYD